MNVFTIKDLENLTGIKAHTIRIWEQRYSFLKPERTGTNIRHYNTQQLKIVLNIALLNKYGYKISHIDRMSESEIEGKIISLSHTQAQYERIVNELIHHMIDLDLTAFENIVDGFILSRGIEKTILHIIFPFLERIGILWVTSHINPAQEHLVSNIIRQKLIMGIESAATHVHANKSALLFLPEGEYHELGLLFVYYMLKTRGIQVYYIGANAPLEDVVFVADLKKPDLLYTHLTSVAPNFNFERFLNKVSVRIHDRTLVVSGKMCQQYKKKVPHKVLLKNSLPEVIEYIGSVS